MGTLQNRMVQIKQEIAPCAERQGELVRIGERLAA